MFSTKDLRVGVVPKNMNAWVIRENRHGAPHQAMQMETVELPQVDPGEVLIAVMAAGINYNGLWVSRGKPVPLSRLRTGYTFHIAGSDAAGIVWYVGEGVKRWKPGDEVVVHCNVSCRQCEFCNGLDPLACREQRIWGYETNWGSYAPFAKVQAQQLLPKPPHLTWEEASAYCLCFFTAYRMLVTRAGIQAGENVLIWGAAGGLGHFAVQLCRLYGANPIGVVSSDEKIEFCRDLGCERTINRLQFDFSTIEGRREFGREVRRLTGGHDPDVVFEHVGQATFPVSVYVCKRFGRVVVCGATSGYNVKFDARYLWVHQKSILGSHFANSYDATRANRLMMERRIKPMLWEIYSLEHIPDAQALMEQNIHMGKIVALVQAETTGLGIGV